jgi:hypothetical protein
MKAGHVCSLLVSCALAGCAAAASKTRPAALDKTAAEFRAMVGSNRIAEAKKLACLLPGCPVHHVRVQGAHGLFPRTEWIDGEHPSYMLSQQDLFKALGEPDRLASGWDLIPTGQVRYYPDRSVYRQWSLPIRPDRVYAYYDVGRDRRNSAWQLLLVLCDAHVCSAQVIKQGSVRSPSIGTLPDGQSIATTNHLQ